jgi:hypothetical protein
VECAIPADVADKVTAQPDTAFAEPREVAGLEADLAGVDRAIHLLAIPIQHSDQFFSIKSHLDLVRVRLGLRRAELEAALARAA